MNWAVLLCPVDDRIGLSDMSHLLAKTALALAFSALLGARVAAQSERAYEHEPIRYSEIVTRDRVARAVASNSVKLRHEASRGYLTSLLRLLEIPETSQGLVFSKTSFQHAKIRPSNPRAIYFGDEVFVGYVPGGDVLEITAMDAQAGPVFYTLDQSPDAKPRFVRRSGECLQCHASTRTHGWPGNIVRSVVTEDGGNPRTDLGSHTTTHESPIKDRWGGWYVSVVEPSGERDRAAFRERFVHMGNRVVPRDNRRRHRPGEAHSGDDEPKQISIASEVAVGRYASRHSDVVALMVLEHQMHMHNVLSSSRFEARRTLHHAAAMREAARGGRELSKAAQRKLRRIAEDVVEALLFKHEARLDVSVAGPSSFVTDFGAKARRDAKGRSLRDFDLQARLFRYPCSYLIYSPSFDALPKIVLDRVYERLRRVLDGRGNRAAWGLSAEQRESIRTILLETKAGLRERWKDQ